jgi:hypothetical protein
MKIEFPVAAILDRDAFVWMTLPSGFTRGRLVGTCTPPTAMVDA